MGKAYDDALARWRRSPEQRQVQNIYLEWWKAARNEGTESESDEDAAILNRTLDAVEGHICYPLVMDSTDYDETMRAVEIMEELNGDQEEGNSNLIAGMVEAS